MLPPRSGAFRRRKPAASLKLVDHARDGASGSGLPPAKAGGLIEADLTTMAGRIAYLLPSAGESRRPH